MDSTSKSPIVQCKTRKPWTEERRAQAKAKVRTMAPASVAALNDFNQRKLPEVLQRLREDAEALARNGKNCTPSAMLMNGRSAYVTIKKHESVWRAAYEEEALKRKGPAV